MKITRIKSWKVATVFGVALWVSVVAAACTTQTDDSLYCGEYTQANTDGTNGCEMLPQYQALLDGTTLPDCTAEDSSESYPCVWDATLHGNGKGRSFVRYNVEHVEWTDDIRENPDGYRETCQLSGRQVTCWSK